MASDGFFRGITIITGVLIAGEALALLVGMYLLSPRPNPWIMGLHTFFIALDILCGAGLIYLCFNGATSTRDGLIFIIVLISAAAHVFRDWQYFNTGREIIFLTNTPLFIFNNVKLIGLIVIGVITIGKLV
jgi:hypothetical protein